MLTLLLLRHEASHGVRPHGTGTAFVIPSPPPYKTTISTKSSSIPGLLGWVRPLPPSRRCVEDCRGSTSERRSSYLPPAQPARAGAIQSTHAHACMCGRRARAHLAPRLTHSSVSSPVLLAAPKRLRRHSLSPKTGPVITATKRCRRLCCAHPRRSPTAPATTSWRAAATTGACGCGASGRVAGPQLPRSAATMRPCWRWTSVVTAGSSQVGCCGQSHRFRTIQGGVGASALGGRSLRASCSGTSTSGVLGKGQV